MTREVIVGYCTNVHAGATFDETIDNLRTHALRVKEGVAPTESMGVGLWLSANAAQSLVNDQRIGELRDFLIEHGLRAFTFNGFPFGDFHQSAVKHAVYEPNWCDAERVTYTLDLINILSALLGEGEEGSISTLPLGWGADWTQQQSRYAAEVLKRIAGYCAEIENRTGCLIHIDFEPEPGCALQRSSDVTAFFESYCQDDTMRRHIRVCHDICHAAVMFEKQDDVLKAYANADITVGKVQVSSAIRAMLPTEDAAVRDRVLQQLSAFQEDRYLHQTMLSSGGTLQFFDDLPHAMQEIHRLTDRAIECRVHFHVPIYLDRFGDIQTSRDEINACIQSRYVRHVKHWEVETYAWDVLPGSLQQPVLADGIARELQWFEAQRQCDEEAQS